MIISGKMGPLLTTKRQLNLESQRETERGEKNSLGKGREGGKKAKHKTVLYLHIKLVAFKGAK